MERRGNQDRAAVGDGKGREDFAPRVAGPDDPRAAGSNGSVWSWVGWQSALYVFVLVIACVFLAPLTTFWWVVPVLGAAVPIALTLLAEPGHRSLRADDKAAKERELLGALAERRNLTPAAAAMRTSLTVDEAQGMLEDLARKGHLELHAGDGIVSYSLAERDRPFAPSETGALLRPASGEGGVSGDAPGSPEEPLSERELEVLALLASGRTNAEIAKDLFVALGTVKSHVNNIYRKLGAANRAEAVTQARKMNLLR